MGGAAGAPDRLESLERGIDHRANGPVVAERRDSADGEARCVAYLAAFGLADTGAKLLRIDSPVACAETKERRFAVDEHEGLDDLSDLDADRIRGLVGSPGRVGELSHLGVEAELSKSFLKAFRRWMHGRNLSR